MNKNIMVKWRINKTGKIYTAVFNGGSRAFIISSMQMCGFVTVLDAVYV